MKGARLKKGAHEERSEGFSTILYIYSIDGQKGRNPT